MCIKLGNGEEGLSRIIAWVMLTLFIYNAGDLVNTVYNGRLEQIYYFSRIFCVFIEVAMVVFNMQTIARRIGGNGIILLGGLLVLLAISFLHNANSPTILQLMWDFIHLCIPIFVVIICIRDYDMLLMYMEKASFIILLSAVAVSVAGLMGKSTQYHMGYSEALIVPVLTGMNAYFRKKDKRMGILSIGGIVSIVLLGSRGSLLSIAAFILSTVALSNSRKKSNYILLLSIAAIFAAVFLKPILSAISVFLNRYGIYSRTIWIYVNNFRTGNRDVIYETLLKSIKESPLEIRLLGGDTMLLGGGYAHNLFLELLVDFGVVIGGLLIVMVMHAIWKMYRGPSKIVNHDTGYIFLCASLPVMMVSGCLFRGMFFWAWIAYLAGKRTAKNRFLRVNHAYVCI